MFMYSKISTNTKHGEILSSFENKGIIIFSLFQHVSSQVLITHHLQNIISARVSFHSIKNKVILISYTRTILLDNVIEGKT